jgi:transcription antitermination factor NusG
MDNHRFEMFPQPGDKVRVCDGTFEGITAEVVGSDDTEGSVRVRLAIYGRSLVIDVARDEIERLA